MRRSRRPIEVFSLSFLDVISCGFGAIVLLLVIMKISEPSVIEETTRDISLSLASQTTEISALKDQSAALYRTQEQLQDEENRLLEQIADLSRRLDEAREIQNDLVVERSSQEAILQQF